MNPIPNYDGSRPEPPYTTECEECDRLRSELDAVAKERSGPHCLRCRNAAVCSTRDDDRSIPLCVADPEGSMPLWDPVTRADVQAVVSELDAARAELARARASASAVFSYLDDRASFGSGNAPGHAHTRPGIWDDDNGTKAGSECEWCKTWNAFRAELARMEEP